MKNAVDQNSEGKKKKKDENSGPNRLPYTEDQTRLGAAVQKHCWSRKVNQYWDRRTNVRASRSALVHRKCKHSFKESQPFHRQQNGANPFFSFVFG